MVSGMVTCPHRQMVRTVSAMPRSPLTEVVFRCRDPGPRPRNGQQTPLPPESKAHHPILAGFCTIPYPLRGRRMLTQGPPQLVPRRPSAASQTTGTGTHRDLPVALPVQDGVQGGFGGGCARTEPQLCCVSTQVAAARLGRPRRDTAKQTGIRLARVRMGCLEAGCP